MAQIVGTGGREMLPATSFATPLRAGLAPRTRTEIRQRSVPLGQKNARVGATFKPDCLFANVRSQGLTGKPRPPGYGNHRGVPICLRTWRCGCARRGRCARLG